MRPARSDSGPPPRIVIDARKLGDLGIGTYVVNLIRELSRIDEEREYHLLCAPGTDEAALPRLGTNFRVHRLNAGKYSLRELWSLPARLRLLKADLFHSPHYVLPPWRPCPAVVTIHDLIHLRFPELLPSRLARPYAHAMLRIAVRAEAILTVSESSRDDIVELLGVRPERIRVVHNGLDPHFLEPVAPDALARLRRKYDLPERFVLYVGNINPHKNVVTLLAAFRILRESEPELDLVLVGGSQRRDRQVEEIRGAIARAEHVRALGLIDLAELPALYRLAELFVTPSLYEGFGLPPLEALACGTPVVAARSSSLPEVLGDAALWSDPRSPDEMASAMLRLIQDGALRKDLLERGSIRAREFSWSRAARATLAAYRELLDR